MKCSLVITNFLEEISSLSHSIIFLYFSALITEEGFPISPFCSSELCIQMRLSFLFSFAFHVFSHLFVRPPQTTILPFCISFPWVILFTASCAKSRTSVHSSSGTLSDLIPWIYSSLPLYNHKGFKSYLNCLVVFPTFFNLSLNFSVRCSWFEPQSALSLVFAYCIEILHLWPQRI